KSSRTTGRTVQSTYSTREKPGGDRMLVGQPGGWSLPWAVLGQCDHGSRLWRYNPGQGDRDARGLYPEDGRLEEDHREPDDGRSQTGLHHRRGNSYRQWLIQRWKRAIA